MHVSNIAHVDPRPASRPGSASGCSTTAARCASPAAPARSSTGEVIEHGRACRSITRRSWRPALMQEFGYKNPMQVPRLEKIVINMGVGEAVQRQQEARSAPRRADRDQPARSRSITKAEAVDRELQAARGHADRLQGDPAPGADVRVPRPADQRGAAARARLSRRVAARASTAAATSRSASRSRSSSPRSTTTRSTTMRGMDIMICTTAKTDAEAKALLEGLRHAVPVQVTGRRSARWRRRAPVEKNSTGASWSKQIRAAAAAA